MIGDLRGAELFCGLDLVQDPATLEPAPEEADRLTHLLLEQGCGVGARERPKMCVNIPPLVFTPARGEWLLDRLEHCLQRL